MIETEELQGEPFHVRKTRVGEYIVSTVSIPIVFHDTKPFETGIRASQDPSWPFIQGHDTREQAHACHAQVVAELQAGHKPEDLKWTC